MKTQPRGIPWSIEDFYQMSCSSKIAWPFYADFPRVDLHLTEEDCAIPSTWWLQMSRIANGIERVQ